MKFSTAFSKSNFPPPNPNPPQESWSQKRPRGSQTELLFLYPTQASPEDWETLRQLQQSNTNLSVPVISAPYGEYLCISIGNMRGVIQIEELRRVGLTLSHSMTAYVFFYATHVHNSVFLFCCYPCTCSLSNVWYQRSFATETFFPNLNRFHHFWSSRKCLFVEEEYWTAAIKNFEIHLKSWSPKVETEHTGQCFHFSFWKSFFKMLQRFSLI